VPVTGMALRYFTFYTFDKSGPTCSLFTASGLPVCSMHRQRIWKEALLISHFAGGTQENCKHHQSGQMESRTATLTRSAMLEARSSQKPTQSPGCIVAGARRHAMRQTRREHCGEEPRDHGCGASRPETNSVFSSLHICGGPVSM
jgi:hypothetical protein